MVYSNIYMLGLAVYGLGFRPVLVYDFQFGFMIYHLGLGLLFRVWIYDLVYGFRV